MTLSEQIIKYLEIDHKCIVGYENSTNSESHLTALYFFTVSQRLAGWLVLPSIFEILRVDIKSNKIFVCVKGDEFLRFREQFELF